MKDRYFNDYRHLLERNEGLVGWLMDESKKESAHYLENYLHLHEIDEGLINWLNGIERTDTTDSVLTDGSP